MYPILILREELVCLIILIFLFFISRTYRMGSDGKRFNWMLICALVHVVMDAVTVWTVNHTETVPYAVNYACHVVFYLAALLFAQRILVYTAQLFYPEREDRFNRVSLALVGAYLVMLPFLKIEFRPGVGTYASAGSAAYVGYAVAYVFFLVSLLMILLNWKTMGQHIRIALVPMLLILVAAETVQIFVREFLFTGGAITAVTVGFFFSLENPIAVLERKAMLDAMTGVENRNSYERDILEYDRIYQANPTEKFLFLFADMNNLKSVNGMFGHDAGDEYITFIATTMLQNLKSAEHIYRMGGDEFLAIYRNTDEETVIRGIEKIRETCRKEAEKRDYTPMLAIGYAISGPQYRNLHDVLRVADYMMYRNKAELKREVAIKAGRQGTKLNLTGLMDRVFDAMCLSSDQVFPYLTNLETGVTRVAPDMDALFGLGDEFFEDFDSVWQARIHPDDRKAYQDDLHAALKGEKKYHVCSYRAMDADGHYLLLTCRGGVYHGKDGEPDIFSGYIMSHGPAENGTIRPASEGKDR